ncbi:Sodium-dependent dicarboxylate transporter SdcS [compost metagenome]
MAIAPSGPLCGKTILEAGLRHLAHGYLIDIQRGNEILAAVSPSERLQSGDQLFFVGTADAVVELRGIAGLQPADGQPGKLDVEQHQRRLVEVVIAPASNLEGKTVREARFRTHYNAAILSISRNGARLQGKIGDITLRGGDTLLLETSNGFAEEQRDNHAFLLVNPLDNTRLPDHRKAPLALGILIAMIVANTTGLLPMLQAAMVAAGGMLALRCIGASQARNSLDLGVLVVIAASFALGTALTATGAASAVAQQLVGSSGSPLMALALVYALTAVFTEVITNNAAAVLMMPIVLAISEQLGVSHMPFVIAIMFAASASFMTPIGYQTNLMVYGPGGYYFSDYLRIGLPLNLFAGIVTVTLVPQFWPF